MTPLDPIPLPAVPMQLLACNPFAVRPDLPGLTMPRLAAQLVEGATAVLEADVPVPRLLGCLHLAPPRRGMVRASAHRLGSLAPGSIAVH
jgi:hypothetical protein